MVNSSVALAKRFNISDMVIGMTLVAIGTSAPEIVVSIVGAVGGSPSIALGNVYGSNICNILLIFGLTTIISPIIITSSNKKMEIPALLFATLLTTLFVITSQNINRLEGAILLLCGIGFLAYSYYITKKEKELNHSFSNSYENMESRESRENTENTENTENIDNRENKVETDSSIPQIFRKIYQKKSFIPIAVSLFILSCAVLIWGGNLFVNGAKQLAEKIGMSQMVIAATIIAIGTSLPELATSVVAAIKKNSGIALGNIVGSNIINISFALGASGLINPLQGSVEQVHTIFFLLSAILLFIFALTAKKRIYFHTYGIIFLIMYIIYIYLIIT